MARYVKLTPIGPASYKAYITATESSARVFVTFQQGSIYELSDQGYVDIKNYTLELTKTDERLSEAISMGLAYTIHHVGCTPCQKKRGIDPTAFDRYIFKMFVEVDKDTGDILESELTGVSV